MSDNKFRPQKINDETVSISNYYIPIKQIGCNLDACSIINYWEHLEKASFPLAQISSLLVALEYIDWTKKNMTSLLPFPMHIIRMVDAIYCAESIKEGRHSRISFCDSIKYFICCFICSISDSFSLSLSRTCVYVS